MAIVLLLVALFLIAWALRDDYPPANWKDYDDEPEEKDPSNDQWRDGV